METPGQEMPGSGSRRVPGKLALVALLILGAVLVLFLVLRDRTPLATREIVGARRQQWAAAGIENYRLQLTVEIDGQKARNYRVVVQEGKVTSFLMDGRDTPPREEYSVRGLFETLDRELEMAQRQGPRQEGTPRGAIVRAEFDRERGYPTVIKRLAPRQSFFITVKGLEITTNNTE